MDSNFEPKPTTLSDFPEEYEEQPKVISDSDEKNGE